MEAIPEALAKGPFTTQEAFAAGVTPRMLRGARFKRVHRGVYVLAGHEQDTNERIQTARLAVPSDARLTHVSRVRALGLDWGSDDQLHFVVARDLHVKPRGIMLHRTEVMPPTDDVGVTPAAAFMAMCATECLLDLIGIGDWLLHHGHMTSLELRELSRAQPWRRGARQAMRVSGHLNERAASIPESSMRTYLEVAGLPRPLVNVPLFDDANSPIVDLLFARWLVVAEYEGGHHFADAAQIKRDIWRYAKMRGADIEYVQIYAELLAQPKSLVWHVYNALARRGYSGERPQFGPRWDALFSRVA